MSCPRPPSYLRFFRRPKTTQEMKTSADPEYGDFVRAKRNIRNLVNAWDDIRLGRKKWPSQNQLWKSRRGFRKTIRRWNYENCESEYNVFESLRPDWSH